MVSLRIKGCCSVFKKLIKTSKSIGYCVYGCITCPVAPINCPNVHSAAPRFSGADESPNISKSMTMSSCIHCCSSAPPPVTSAKSPIASNTDKTTPGFGSGSFNFGTKIWIDLQFQILEF